MKGKTSEDPLVNNDPRQLAADRAQPKPKTFGDFIPPLGAITPASDAKEAFESAQRLFEFEQSLVARQRRRVNPSVEQAYWKAYDIYCQVSSKQYWAKPSGQTGGSQFPPRGRWKFKVSSRNSESSDASDFHRHPSAE